MELILYKQYIIKSIKDEDAKLPALLQACLQQNRKQCLLEVGELISELDSRSRLMLLSTLVTDGSKDLIPYFVKGLLKESNILFAKPILSLVGQLEYMETLSALRAIKNQLRSELDAIYQRVTGKLNGMFRENFYMDEFVAGNKNPKRMKNAVTMMLSNPNPIYIPFLNDVLTSRDIAYHEHAVHILEKLGDESSIQVMLGLLTGLLQNRLRNELLFQFILDPKVLATTNLSAYIGKLGELGQWEASLSQELVKEILDKKLKTCLQWVYHSFGPFEDAFVKSFDSFFTHLLKKNEADENKASRLKIAIQSSRSRREHLIIQISTAIGFIGARTKQSELEDSFDAAMPKEVITDDCLIAFLGSLRGDSARERLLQYLAKGDASWHMATLTALEGFDMEEVPPSLPSLISKTEDSNLRLRIIKFLVRCKPLPEHLTSLLHSQSAGLKRDTIAVITESGLETGYALLLEELSSEMESAQQITVIEALAAFPRAQTGVTVYPFFLLPHEYPVRQAATETLALAGGPHRMALLFQGLETYPVESGIEIYSTVLTLLGRLPPEKLPLDLVKDAERWCRLLQNTSERLRNLVITILEKAIWRKKSQAKSWIKPMQTLLEGGNISRHSSETGRLNKLLQKIRSIATNGPGPREANAKFHDDLLLMMEHIETGFPFERVAALRKLNLSFKAASIGSQEKKRLVHQMLLYFQESQDDSASLKLAISIAAKIADTSLEAEIAKLMDHKDPELVRFARTAHSMMLKNRGVTLEVKRIFIMDTSLVMVKTLEKALTGCGYKVAMATQPKQGLAVLSEQAFDLLLVNYHLDDVTGVQFFKEAKAHRFAPRHLIYFTSSQDENEQVAMRVTGADSILFKPFSMEELLEKVKALANESEQATDT